MAAEPIGDGITATVRWTGDRTFEGEFRGGERTTLASGGNHPGPGPSPIEAIQSALAACSGVDVVEILQKMRQGLATLAIEVAAERRDAQPRVYTRIHLVYRITGPELDAEQVVRAVELSQDKYCSVAAMLRPTVALSWEVWVNENFAARSAAAPPAP
jgi:putative redox protein